MHNHLPLTVDLLQRRYSRDAPLGGYPFPIPPFVTSPPSTAGGNNDLMPLNLQVLRNVDHEHRSIKEEDSGEDKPRACVICKGDSETFHLNYGAASCFSCRAFFRRAIQKNRNPTFGCKRGGNCEINFETRKQCRRCRFELCIKAGMMPNAVLDEGQKKDRFRKMIQKKGGLSMHPKGGSKKATRAVSDMVDSLDNSPAVSSVGSPDSSPPAASLDLAGSLRAFRPRRNSKDSDESFETLSLPDNIRRKESNASSASATDDSEGVGSTALVMSDGKPKFSYKRKLLQMYQEEEERASNSTDECTSSLDNGSSLSPPSPKVVRMVEPAMQNLTKHKLLSLSYCWISARLLFKVPSDLVESFVNFHLYRTRLTKEDFLSFLGLLAKLFHNFAEQYPDFCILSPTTRQTLLRENTAIFLSFYLGKYLTAPSGAAQIAWLFPAYKIDPDTASRLNLISFDDIQDTVHLFRAPAEVAAFGTLARGVGEFTVDTSNVHIVTHTSLFDRQQLSSIDNADDRQLVNGFGGESAGLAREEGLKCTDMAKLMSILRNMARIFVANVEQC